MPDGESKDSSSGILLCPQPLFFVIPSQDKESLDVFDHAGEPSGDVWPSNRTRHSYRKGRE